MSNKTNTRDLNIRFIHQFKRSTRTEWPDRFRLCWFFDPNSLDYIYEHKNEHFITNGFVLSDALVKQLPEGFQRKYFEPCERCLLFLLFEVQIVNFVNSEFVDSDEFENTFGVSKKRYFSTEAIDEWTEQIELL